MPLLFLCRHALRCLAIALLLIASLDGTAPSARAQFTPYEVAPDGTPSSLPPGPHVNSDVDLTFAPLDETVPTSDERIDELERQLAELRASLGTAAATARIADAPPAEDFTQPTSLLQAPAPAAKPAAPAAHAPIKYPTIVMTGFAQIDGLWFHQTDRNQAAVGDADDSIDFRRTRLAAKGQLAENVAYMLEMDFAFPGRPTFMDVFMDMQQLPGIGTFRVGQWRQPLNLEAQTSVRDLLFLERSLSFVAFVPFRQTGAGIFNTAFDDHATWAVSMYRFPTNTFGNVFGDDGYGGSARITALPISDDDSNTNLHFGVGFTANAPSTGVLRFRTPPEVGINVLDLNSTLAPVPFFVDTGPIAAGAFQLLDAEFAASFMNVLFQTEALGVFVNQEGGPSTTFYGGYAQASYVLTGEGHKYNKKAAAFGRVVPDHAFGKAGCGAWEIAGRWSCIDLNDENIQGGRLHDWTFGLNWYLNGFAKLQFNYVRPLLDSPLNGHSTADIFATRAQFDF